MARSSVCSMAMTMVLVAAACGGCAHQDDVMAPRAVPAAATTRPALDDGQLARRLSEPSNVWSIGWGVGAAQLVFFPGGRYVLEYYDSGLWDGATGSWRVHDGEVLLTSEDSFGQVEPVRVLEARIGGPANELVLVPDARKAIFERYGIVREACFRNFWYLLARETTRPAGSNGSVANPMTVRAQDIPEKVQILGVLGQPLGSLVTIRGKWMSPEGVPKDASLGFHVNLINGKEFKEGVELRRLQVRSIMGKRGRGPNAGENWDWRADFSRRTEPPPSPAEGETWEMMGIETASFHSYPEEVWREMGTLVPQMPPYVGGLTTCFEFVTVRKIW